VGAVVERSGVVAGVAHVFSRHTTAAIRVNENEPLLLADLQRLLERLAPLGSYEHDDMTRRAGVLADEPVNGHAHCRHLLLGASESVPIIDGVLALGRWQSIFLVELDGGRRRQVTVHAMGT
jgi:secondary thiamine-phosphate synthase enzyme